jgi:hypothetical protein
MTSGTRRRWAAAEVEAFLTSLAVDRDVAAATQNLALSAILFLYREVLEMPLPWLDGIERAKKPARLPTVLSAAEVGGRVGAAGWHHGPDAAAALRHRHAPDGMRAPAGQGCRFRPRGRSRCAMARVARIA